MSLRADDALEPQLALPTDVIPNREAHTRYGRVVRLALRAKSRRIRDGVPVPSFVLIPWHGSGEYKTTMRTPTSLTTIHD